MAEIIIATANDFSEKVLGSGAPVLVDFWAAWCGPCRAIAPVLEELARDMDGRLAIAKVDVEDPLNRDLVMRYGIMSIPNMKLFKNGEVVREIIGLRSKEQLLAEIQSAL